MTPNSGTGTAKAARVTQAMRTAEREIVVSGIGRMCRVMRVDVSSRRLEPVTGLLEPRQAYRRQRVLRCEYAATMLGLDAAKAREYAHGRDGPWQTIFRRFLRRVRN